MEIYPGKIILAGAKVEKSDLFQKSESILNQLCEVILDRSVGSSGNKQATRFFEDLISPFNWKFERAELDVIDWEDGGATLSIENREFQVLVSPYARGCDVSAALVKASSIAELEQKNCRGKVLLLHGDIAREQLMPKNFVFYNPEEHQKIIALLEQKQPLAIITATARNSALAGGKYPFPLIEDGDFDIPSVYMTEEDGKLLLPYDGKHCSIKSVSRRIPSKAYNILARKEKDKNVGRIVITAHIDAKKGTPGAIDNATGVITLALLAELLADYEGNKSLEIVALNGEDYYAVPGQMDYIRKNQDSFNNVLLNINIDGAGYFEGKSAFSFFNLPSKILLQANNVLEEFPGITEGAQWPQGDHSIFIQQGCPALAVTSQWFLENMDTQDVTHTPKDNPQIVDCRKVVEIAEALNRLIRRI